MIDNASQR